MPKVTCDPAEYGVASPQAQPQLLEAEADARSDGAKGLEGKGLGVLQAHQRLHHLLQLHFGPLAQH